MAQVNFRIDDDVKAEADALFARLGMNMSTAVNIFIHQALYYRGLPFEVKEDPFLSPKNMAHLRTTSDDYAARRNFSKHDLIPLTKSFCIYLTTEHTELHGKRPQNSVCLRGFINLKRAVVFFITAEGAEETEVECDWDCITTEGHGVFGRSPFFLPRILAHVARACA